MKTYFKHQGAAHAYCVQEPNPALFMEMRLGKTLVAIRSSLRRGFKKVLVIAPATALPDWYDELKEEGVRRVRYMKPRNKKEERLLPFLDFGLSSFEYIVRHPEIANGGAWDCVIVDESTRIKEPTAKVTKFMLKNFRNCTRYILSGFPAPEDPLEYVCQMLFLNGELMGCETYWDFRKKHCIPPMVGYDWTLKKSSKITLKKYIAKNAFVLTREVAGVYTPQVYETRYVDQTPSQKKATKALLQDFQLKGHSTKWTVVTASWVAQIAGGLFKDVRYSNKKEAELVKLLEGELKNEYVVIFFRHTQEIEAVSKLLERRGTRFKTVTGDTPKGERAKTTREFRYGKTPSYKVILAQIKCVKFSVNFAAASTAIYYSNSHSLEERVQSEQRIIHVSKSYPVLYIDLVTANTIDEDILEGIKNKTLAAREYLKLALENVKGRL